jgi:hypothetical protein
MKPLDLTKLSVPDAVIFQHGLRALGFYDGTTRGLPGEQTLRAYEDYLTSLKAAAVPKEAASLAARLVDILKSEDGVREMPANSNKGARVQEYQAATWLSGTGWAWCAAFICWGIKQLDDKALLPFPRPRTAGAWDFERWAREDAGPTVELCKPRKAIKAGDIVVFTFSHIGLAIEDEKNGSVKTVEGNTDTSGSREGGGVYVQNRKTSLVRSHIRLFAA